MKIQILAEALGDVLTTENKDLTTLHWPVAGRLKPAIPKMFPPLKE